MVIIGKNFIKFVGALLNLIKLLSTKTCSSASVKGCTGVFLMVHTLSNSSGFKIRFHILKGNWRELTEEFPPSVIGTPCSWLRNLNSILSGSVEGEFEWETGSQSRRLGSVCNCNWTLCTSRPQNEPLRGLGGVHTSLWRLSTQMQQGLIVKERDVNFLQVFSSWTSSFQHHIFA